MAAFRALVERVPLEGQKELSGEFEYVLENTAGCVGMLKDWLRRALAYALRNGLPSIDGKALRETVLDPGAVHEIADDASKLRPTTFARNAGSEVLACEGEDPPQHEDRPRRAGSRY